MKARVNRVFFHELGHFVAHELNAQHFDGYRANAIYISPCANDPNEFCGGTDFDLPDEIRNAAKAAPPVNRLAQYLASIVHGCIFQCYYTKGDFRACFDVHGCNDLRYWSGAIDANKLIGTKPMFSRIEAEYFQTLCKNNVLDGFMQLNPDDYIEETELNHFQVNVKDLRLNTECLVNDYNESYQQLISSYQSLIAKLNL
jgi:hypothetical protein